MWRPATERRRFGPENPTIIACQWPRNQVLWVIERRKDDPLSVKHKSDEASGQQTRFASDLLQFSQSVQDLIAVRANPWVLRHGVLIADAGKVTPGPHSRMDHVARLLDGVPELCTRRRGRNDGNVE